MLGRIMNWLWLPAKQSMSGGSIPDIHILPADILEQAFQLTCSLMTCIWNQWRRSLTAGPLVALTVNSSSNAFSIMSTFQELLVMHPFGKITDWQTDNHHFHMSIGGLVQGTFSCETPLVNTGGDTLISYWSFSKDLQLAKVSEPKSSFGKIQQLTSMILYI